MNLALKPKKSSAILQYVVTLLLVAFIIDLGISYGVVWYNRIKVAGRAYYKIMDKADAAVNRFYKIEPVTDEDMHCPVSV